MDTHRLVFYALERARPTVSTISPHAMNDYKPISKVITSD